MVLFSSYCKRYLCIELLLINVTLPIRRRTSMMKSSNVLYRALIQDRTELLNLKAISKKTVNTFDNNMILILITK